MVAATTQNGQRMTHIDGGSYDADLIIVGGGVVGLILAQSLTPDLSVILIDHQALEQPVIKKNDRAYAINLQSENILNSLLSWPDLKAMSGIYYDMQVFDRDTQRQLHFNCFQENLPHLGHIIHDSALRWHLWQSWSSQGVTLLPHSGVQSIDFSESGVVCKTSQGQLKAPLIVGADGMHSMVRRSVGQSVMRTGVAQSSALVTNVHIAFGHQNTAWQWFLADGPVALLPLTDPDECALIWSTTSKRALELKNLPPERLSRALTDVVGYKLGTASIKDEVHVMPLHMQKAQACSGKQWALVGDAWQTVLPLAGQGLNLGLQDAYVLAGLLKQSCRFSRSTDYARVLRAYQRERSLQRTGMYCGIEVVDRLSTHHDWLTRTLRQGAFIASEHLPWIKRAMLKSAQGMLG